MIWRNTKSTLIDTLLRTQYGFTTLSIEKLERDSPNQVWRVATTTDRLIVKRIARNASLKWFTFQAEMLEFLNQNDLPVVKLFRSLAGEPVTTLKDIKFQVLAFSQGTPLRRGDRKGILEAAKALRKIHESVDNEIDDFPSSPTQDLEYWLKASELDISQLHDTLYKIAGADAKKIFDTFYTNFSKARNNLDITTYNKLPKTLTHGEFIGSNLLFSDDHLTCIIDWDAVQYRPRIFDLCRVYFLTRRGRSNFTLRYDIGRAFLIEALGGKPISPTEYLAMISILRFYFVPTPSYLNLILKKNPAMFEWYLDWCVAGLTSVEKEMEKIYDLL